MCGFLQLRAPAAGCGLPSSRRQQGPGRGFSVRLGPRQTWLGGSRAAPREHACTLGVSFMRVSALFEFRVKIVNESRKSEHRKNIFKKMIESHYQFAHWLINWRTVKTEATWEWVYSGRSGVKHASSDGQEEGLSVKRRHRCLEGSVRGDRVIPTSRSVSVLWTITQFSPKIRIQSVHKGCATCSRAQKYLLRHPSCLCHS